MAIPKNAANKELSWSLMRELASKRATLMEAVNGNGPVRLSTYADPKLQQMVSYAATEATALKWSRVPMPAFSKSAQAKDICVEEMQAALIGLQSAKESATNMQKRIKPLLPG
jgi:multiple sugar transport system substrate-binding protein